MHDEWGAWSLSRIYRVLLITAVLFGITGCSTVGYYGQAVAGHWRIMRARVPVQVVIENPDTEQRTREALQRAQLARRFASDQLALPDNKSYTSYVDLQREAVTWNVIATQSLSIEPERWCFPVAGCLSYRGYFDRADANAYAQQLRDQGLDVAVTEASAYSSLGWFDDPLLSTMTARGEPLLAGVLFHELAHQRLYVKDDSSFNESFASFVEQQGIRQWLQQLDRADLQQRYDDYRSRREQFLALLREARAKLKSVYTGGGTPEQMLHAKARIFSELRLSYQALKVRWGGYSGYDNWFDKPLNNARIAGVSTYNRWVGAFATLFAESGGNYALFYRRSADLAALSRAKRQRRLEELASSGD